MRFAHLLILILALSASPAPAQESNYTEREADWRCGPVIYQVFVDRFAPAADLDAKRDLYAAPRTLRAWDELPRAGHEVPEAGLWSHELEFWGGDLPSVMSRLDHVSGLGAEVLYLNPIHRALTNHKYDAQDFLEIAPEYGTRDDFRTLAETLHARDMRLVLDGVFNHMGRSAPSFQDAQSNPQSEWREWFFFGDEFEDGYRSWYGVANLPELNLENAQVRARLWGDEDSAVKQYLNDGADGWRLDVAYQLGFDHLREITAAAHEAKPESLVIGEIWSYPDQWLNALDGLMNMTVRQMLLQMVRGALPARVAAEQFEQMLADCGLDPLLRSWIVLDNHDSQRLHTALPVAWQRRMAQVLQLTLPGAPLIDDGTEVGMTGGDDPEQRAPMRWDLVNDTNEELQWTRKLLAMRAGGRALRVGDFLPLESADTLAFLRTTDRVADTRLVIANPSAQESSEVLMLRDARIMSYAPLIDELTSAEFRTMSGMLSITVSPETIVVLRPVIPPGPESSPYTRMP